MWRCLLSIWYCNFDSGRIIVATGRSLGVFFTVIGGLAVIYIICMYRYYPLHETYLKQQNIIK